jgi:hypothetical protein
VKLQLSRSLLSFASSRIIPFHFIGFILSISPHISPLLSFRHSPLYFIRPLSPYPSKLQLSFTPATPHPLVVITVHLQLPHTPHHSAGSSCSGIVFFVWGPTPATHDGGVGLIGASTYQSISDFSEWHHTSDEHTRLVTNGTAAVDQQARRPGYSQTGIPVTSRPATWSSSDRRLDHE